MRGLFSSQKPHEKPVTSQNYTWPTRFGHVPMHPLEGRPVDVRPGAFFIGCAQLESRVESTTCSQPAAKELLVTPAHPKLENRIGQSLTGAQIIWESLVREGVEVCFGYPGGAIMPAYDAMIRVPDPPRADPPRAGRLAHGRRVRARLRAGGCLHRDLGTGRHEPGDRHRDGDARLDPDGVHHRAGPVSLDRQRRLPGDRHHGLHDPGHQAQLPGDEAGADRADDPRGVLHRALRSPRPRRGRHHQGCPAAKLHLRMERRGDRPSRLSTRTTLRCRSSSRERST